MKRFLTAALFGAACLFLLPSRTNAQVISVFSGLTANTDTTTMTTKPTGFNGETGTIACGKSCSWRVWSTAGSSATVTAYCRLSSSNSEPWYACDSVSNPGNPGNDRQLAVEREYKFAIESYVSGTISIKYFSSSN